MNIDPSKSQILICGEEVTVVKIIEEKTVSLGDFLNGLTKNIPILTELLPDGTKCIGFDGDKMSICVEIPPGIRPITFSHRGKGESHKITLRLYFPYTYMFINSLISPISIKYVGMGQAKKKITDMDDPIGAIAMPNVTWYPEVGVSAICLGEISIKDNLHMSKGINELIATIWGSHWNNDLWYSATAVTAVEKMLREQPKVIKMEFDNLKTIEKLKPDEKQRLSFLETCINNSLTKENKAAYLYYWEFLSLNSSSEELSEMIVPPLEGKFSDVFKKLIEEMRFA